MDYETMTNLFVGVFQCYSSKETKIFKIHSSLYNDIEPLVKFLQRNKNLKEKHISFNGINFDSQITEFILKNQVKFNYKTNLGILLYRILDLVFLCYV